MVVYGTVFATKRAPHSPLRDLRVPTDEDTAAWHVGMVHGSLAIPDRTDRDEVVVTKEEIAATGLDYLAFGHWHSVQRGKAGTTTYAYSGAPEPVAVNQDGAGNVLLVSLEEKGRRERSRSRSGESARRASRSSSLTPRGSRPSPSSSARFSRWATRISSSRCD